MFVSYESYKSNYYMNVYKVTILLMFNLTSLKLFAFPDTSKKKQQQQLVTIISQHLPSRYFNLN